MKNDEQPVKARSGAEELVKQVIYFNFNPNLIPSPQIMRCLIDIYHYTQEIDSLCSCIALILNVYIVLEVELWNCKKI